MCEEYIEPQTDVGGVLLDHSLPHIYSIRIVDKGKI